MPEDMPTDSHGRYTIKFRDSPSVVRASSFVKAQAAQVSPITIASISSAQGIKPDQLTYGITSTYNSTFLNAVTVTLSGDDLRKLKKRYGDKIEYIEPVQNTYGSGMQQNAPWGLARIGRWDTRGSSNYEYPDAAGQGVDVYVLDTGLITTHPSFEGRAQFVKNCVPGSSDRDGTGHGTHVAGTIASSKYGVAKKANIFGVKILGDSGGGYDSMSVAGIQFVTQRAKPGKTIINMSTGGGKSRFMDDAITAARNAGVLVVVAAGNNRQDACQYSPSSSLHALTVGATDQNDNIAAFAVGGSNYGRCVDIFAPGTGITSLGRAGQDDTSTLDGTSMATPHISGIAAVYMSTKSYSSPDTVGKDILGWSRRCVKGATQGSGIGLAYVNARLQ